jgi:hypothetical protein
MWNGRGSCAAGTAARRSSSSSRNAPQNRGVHGAAAGQVSEFGDEAREIKEHGLEAAEVEHARMEDQRAESIARQLSAIRISGWLVPQHFRLLVSRHRTLRQFLRREALQRSNEVAISSDLRNPNGSDSKVVERALSIAFPRPAQVAGSTLVSAAFHERVGTAPVCRSRQQNGRR